MQCNCMMGVFPEINRAWLIIDSDIFMWNYEDGYVENIFLRVCLVLNMNYMMAVVGLSYFVIQVYS